ncbi:MAG: transposase [Promethearchaeota archaeon]
MLVLDNAQTSHSIDLEPFLTANQDRPELVFLPKYSPDLNPVKRFWKFLRKQVPYDLFFRDSKNFQHAVVRFLAKHKYSFAQSEKKRQSYQAI